MGVTGDEALSCGGRWRFWLVRT